MSGMTKEQFVRKEFMRGFEKVFTKETRDMMIEELLSTLGPEVCAEEMDPHMAKFLHNYTSALKETPISNQLKKGK